MIEKIQNKKLFFGLKVVLLFWLFFSLIFDGRLSRFIHFILYDRFENLIFALLIFGFFVFIVL